ncbi:Kelch-like protein 12 [Nymphon striatum]|nr:Kelch-like protein 12 [Nymphon striatum]
MGKTEEKVGDDTAKFGSNLVKRAADREDWRSRTNEEELNERLLCIGGCNNQKIILNSIEICADSGSIWNKYDQMDPRRTEFASCTYENYIILIGGQGAMQSCTKYNPKNKTFIELEPLPDNRAAHVATIINSTLFICGGCWYTEKSLISLNLNEQNGKWRNRKSSLERREGSTGCSVNNKFYVFGGRNSNSCEYYSPQEDTWRPLLKMKEERFCAGSCYDNNKFIYVVGGRDLRNSNYLTSMERFDVEIGQWLTLKSSIGVGREGLTLTIFKNQIILIGGRDKNNKCYNTIQKYDSISDSWSQIGILKAARSYHCTMNFKIEKFRENPNLNQFEISGFKPENVNKIFEFFYSDSIIINKNDLNEIVRLAKIFQLDRVLGNVFNHVKVNLNIENVLSIRDLWMSCDKMEEVKICDQFIEKNLNDISKLQIFKVIEFNYLKLLMKSNNLVVPDEKRIFEIAIEWLSVDIQTRQQFGQQLMEDVRFPLMSYEFLLQIPDHELIQKKSLRRIMESVHYSNKKEFRTGQNVLKRVDITPRKYRNVFTNEEELNESLICIGGFYKPANRFEGLQVISIEICADSGIIWNKYDEIEPERSNFASCTYENYIILIGGHGARQSCTKYYPKNKTFIELEPLPGRRVGHVATIINSQLLICGGVHTVKSLISLNLNKQNGKWRNRKSSLEERAGSTGCSVNNKLYVFGGQSSNSCEYYCPQEDTWRPLLKMKEERWNAGSCYDNNKFIYVVGGTNRNKIYLTSTERFDVEIGQWLTLKSSIGVGRCGLTLTIFKNQLILIGGRDNNGLCHETVQKYDSISDSWSQIGILKEARAHHCTVNLKF